MPRSDDDRHDPLDERLRRALQPDPEVARRVGNAALQAPASRSLWRPVLVSAVVILVLLGAMLVRRGLEPPTRVSVQVHAVQTGRQSIRNVGDVVTVARPDGQIVAIVSGGTP